MPDGSEAVAVRVLSRINEVDAAEWDACAGPDNPFVSHAFLDALEESGSATAETGWTVQHITIEDDYGHLIGAVPAYLKNHSYGEYVFDWGWAEAFERAGGQYYPKLQVSVPFAPVTGPRLLVRAGEDEGKIRAWLIAGLIELARRHSVSSLHITFATKPEWHELGEAGFLQRTGKQFHWRNDNYACFEDFLETLASRKRKAIRKERREAAAEGVEIEFLTGETLEPSHMEAFYRFYVNTIDRKWSHDYLKPEFFQILARTMADRVVLVMVSYEGRHVAGALNLLGSDTLYGRNWGSIEHFNMLHFEACYYRAIDFAIEHGLARVEAGAQGPHKISRGYLPVTTYSAHWIANSRFRTAIEDFLEHERESVEMEIDALARRSPFRKEDG